MKTVDCVSLGVLLLICLACSEGCESRSQRRADKWEYKYVHAITMIEEPLTFPFDVAGKLHESILREVNELGEQGWELVGVDESVFWFKRKKE